MVWVSACEDFLVVGVGAEWCACVLVDGARSYLSEGRSALSNIEFGGIYGFDIALGNLSADVPHCVPTLLK